MRALRLLVVAPLLVGCSVGFGRPVALDMTVPAQLPENLCDSVPDDIITKWRLHETAHATAVDLVKSVATCDLSGTVGGQSMTLSLRVESRSGEDDDDAAATMERLKGTECGEIRQIGYASGTDADGFYLWNRYRELGDGCIAVIPGDRMIILGPSVPMHAVITADADYTGDAQAGPVDEEVGTTLVDLKFAMMRLAEGNGGDAPVA